MGKLILAIIIGFYILWSSSIKEDGERGEGPAVQTWDESDIN